jgi:crotonobetainyl-CoA:carnitine CoA-transferase CaiB-like acyl-CoA transferase
MNFALEGVRVLDLSRFIAGPSCTMLLADMGADVIKVERPGGEDSRQVAPFMNGHSVYTMVFNRNKRAITVNTRDEQGRNLLRKLVREWADVVVENYRPGTMDKMGLGYEQLKTLKEDIILTSVSGLGQTGPLKDRAMFDAAAQAMSGLAYRNGRPDDPPMFTGVFLADYIAGAYAAFGTMAALFHRELTGEGQVVDVALLDSLFSVLGVQMAAWLLLREKMPRTGNRDLYTAPAKIFEAADGYIYFHGGTDSLFKRLASAMGKYELAEDPRFATSPARMENVEELEKIVDRWVREQSVAEISAKLEEAGIPYGPVADIPEATSNPQLRAREMMVEVDHAQAGRIVVPGIVAKLSKTPGSVHMAPPTVGQHNQEVFCDLLKLSPQELEELRSQGVV